MNDAVKSKFVPKVLKVITVPQTKIRPGMELFLLIVAPIVRAPALKNAPVEKDSEGKEKLPPHLLRAVDLETGEITEIIPGTVLVDLMQETYPLNSYVGRSFQVKCNEQKAAKAGGGRRYNTYSVNEIETPAELGEAAEKARASVVLTLPGTEPAKAKK